MHDVRPAVIELTIVRLKEFVRETEAIFWVFGFPLLLTLALGFAFREKPPDRIPVGVVRGGIDAQRMKALAKSPALQPRLFTLAEGRDAVRRGKISLLVEGETSPVYRFDATRPEARNARLEVDAALQSAAGRRDLLPTSEVRVTGPGSRYIDFLVPGLLGMNLMGTGIWGMSFTIVNARMRKLLKRLVATPMRKIDYLFAQFLSRLVFLLVEVGVVVTFARIVFGVRIHGSLLTFTIVCLIGGFAFSGLGILVASRATTIEAISGITNLVMMPMWLCSGVFFSYERFPDAVKPFIRALPLTALNDALRAVMNDAAGMAQVVPQIALLSLWAVAGFTAGLKLFRWQ